MGGSVLHVHANMIGEAWIARHVGETTGELSEIKWGVVFGVGTWGASLWVGALGCTGAELEAFPV